MDPLNELNTLKDMYTNTLRKLKEYSGSSNTIVNIPISSVGFIQGKLINTNKISVCISSLFNLETDLNGCEEIINKKLKGKYYNRLS